MKEKESFIRKEIEFGENLLKLESDCLQKSKDNELLIEQVQRIVKSNEELKESLRTTSTINKDISSELCNLKT